MNVVPIQLLSELRRVCPQSEGIPYGNISRTHQIPHGNEVREYCKAKAPRYYIQTIAHHFVSGSACADFPLDDIFLSTDEDTLV